LHRSIASSRRRSIDELDPDLDQCLIRLPLVARAPRMRERALEGVDRRLEAHRDVMRPGDRRPCPCEALVVVRFLQLGQRALGDASQALEAAFRFRERADVRTQEQGEEALARIFCSFDRRRGHLVSPLEVPCEDERVRQVGGKLETKWVGRWHKSKGALEQIRRSVGIAAGERASTGRGEGLRRASPNAFGVLV